VIAAQHYLLSGRVQGVGFRPYVYRLAIQHGLTGWVKNLAGQVEIKVQGTPAALDTFAQALVKCLPPLAQLASVKCEPADVEALTTFTILHSECNVETQIHVPPDYFTCDECLAELQDPQDRRYRYPFINCTQCGPRYTLIEHLPYDRPNTSMADFSLCAQCAAEYHNPLERRFHAQPLACPRCGPQVSFHYQHQWIEEPGAALAACVHSLRQGHIIAVKGIGGYHLLCAADNDSAIKRLRAQKPRPDKPLAIMLPLNQPYPVDIALKPQEVKLLHSPLRPIVLVQRQEQGSLSAHIAPGLTEIGVMLPYSPLHHLLLEALAAPVVATSANISGEPVLTDNDAVEQRLATVADGFLHHNRAILRPADDALFRTIASRPRPLRLGRGNAPLELELPFTVPEALLAVGGQMKNTVALAWQNRVIISPHIGALDSPRGLEVFTQVITDLQKLYNITAQKLICDAHPRYASSQWARQSGLPWETVYHHHAHASALAGEFLRQTPWLIFTWDGVGFGVDGQLWGGETFYGQPGNWQRVAHLRPFLLPGGEKASRQLWRSALSLCWQTGMDWPLAPQGSELLYQAWQRQINCPQTTAVGRLFDAAAALIGQVQVATFEGQGPMWLEALSQQAVNHTIIPLPLSQNTAALWETDWAPLLPYLLDEHLPLAERAASFHHSLAQAVVQQVLTLRQSLPFVQVGLCGGVFQNRLLTEAIIHALEQRGFTVFIPQQLPSNDASLSFGQIIESSWPNTP